MDQENQQQESNWKPLESNPEVINQYINELGFDTTKFTFQDLYSYEQWAQDMIPKPCHGLLFIFPHTQNHDNHRKAEQEQIEADGQVVDSELFYMHQYARNACGTIGVFHILGNFEGENKGLIAEGSKLAKFYEECKGKNAHDCGMIFKGSKAVQESHTEAVEQGETDVRDFLTLG
jgi:ubiquitin carboxyl-terminal hydrolase L3